MINRMICAARAAWYATTEPARLRRARPRWPDNVWLGCFAPDDNPLVTVYIPTYNRVDLLMGRALPSVLAQTYTNIEIIVAAHGCTDRTHPEVWDAGCHYDVRVRLMKVPRTQTYPPTAENHWMAGPVVPANAALKAARGAWVMRLDDDDKLAPDAVEKLLRFAQEADQEFVSAAHETHEGKVKPYIFGGTMVGGIQTSMYRSYLRFFRYNRFCYLKDNNRVNDVDLQDRMQKAGVRMGYLNEIVAYVMPRPGETQVGIKAYTRDREATEQRLTF